MRKYENFIFFDIDDLNEKMEENWGGYNLITITKSFDCNLGDIYIAWIVKK